MGLTVMSASADEAQKAKLMEIGKANYATCMACHGADGQGLPAGDKKMAPSLVDSKIAVGDPAQLALVILKGIQKENQDYLGMMAPLEMALDDEKLAGVMTFIRNSYGHKASVVTPEDAKKFREQFKEVKAPVTRAKIAELVAPKK